jgi:hypothetical protein
MHRRFGRHRSDEASLRRVSRSVAVRRGAPEAHRNAAAFARALDALTGRAVVVATVLARRLDDMAHQLFAALSCKKGAVASLGVRSP